MFSFHLLVTTGYLVDTSGYLVVTSGYLIATTCYFWLLVVTSCYFWFLVLVTTRFTTFLDHSLWKEACHFLHDIKVSIFRCFEISLQVVILMVVQTSHPRKQMIHYFHHLFKFHWRCIWLRFSKTKLCFANIRMFNMIHICLFSQTQSLKAALLVILSEEKTISWNSDEPLVAWNYCSLASLLSKLQAAHVGTVESAFFLCQKFLSFKKNILFHKMLLVSLRPDFDTEFLWS